MVIKIFKVICDWCGEEVEYSIIKRQKDVINDYAKRFLVYKLANVNPLSDELFVKSKSFVADYRTFCCEECVENYFKEYPEDRSHYKLVKPKIN